MSTHGIRVVRDRISRSVLEALREAGIPVASQTIELVAAPELAVLTR